MVAVSGAQPVSQPALDDVRAAQETLERHVARLAMTDDPVADTVAACAALVKVSNRLVVDSATQMEQSRQPLSKADLKELLRGIVYQVNHALTVRAISLQRSVIAGAAAAAVALVAIGWLACAWWYPRADISGMVCQNQDGGRFCAVWVTPPSGQAAKR
jgi:hypothetical protein